MPQTPRKRPRPFVFVAVGRRSDERFGHTRSPTGPPRSPLSPYRSRSSKWSLKRHESGFKSSASPSSTTTLVVILAMQGHQEERFGMLFAPVGVVLQDRHPFFTKMS
ncbi:hypothetical protein GQ457_09G017070 [Hibiscus cannabinus]